MQNNERQTPFGVCLFLFGGAAIVRTGAVFSGRNAHGFAENLRKITGGGESYNSGNLGYKHGVYASEQPTSMVAPISGTAGLQVVIGTAPVNMLKNPAEAVNKPKLVTTYAEAVAAVGYNPDFKSYTICESISAKNKLFKRKI